MKNKNYLIIVFFFLVQIVFASDYYCDPVNGSMSNDGSQSSPWTTLQDVINNGKKFNAGDVIYLLSGAHGEPYLSGYNSDYVTIKAAEGHNPVIASTVMANGSFWAFDGITFSIDGSGGASSRSSLISTNNTLTHLKVTNCTFHCGEDSSDWTNADWYANTEKGIAVIIRGENLIFNSNTLTNVYHAFEMDADYAEVKNNLIDNFAADAIRALGSHAVYEGNIIRDAYVEDYNVNHDDGIQMYDRDDIANGTIENVIIRGNTIINFADPVTQSMIDNDLVSYQMQGIISTDGHSLDIVVENNLVVNDHYHGITLTEANNCRIQNNTVFKTPHSNNPKTDAIPRIQLYNGKLNGVMENNIFRNNLSNICADWTYDENVNLSENNIVVNVNDANVYFYDYDNFEFSLKENSPAIDAGVNRDVSEFDINNKSRLIGINVDVGCYEYNGQLSVFTPETHAKQLKLYPNPVIAGNLFTVNVEGFNGDVKMTIFNVTGQIVAKEFIGSAKKYQSKSNFEKGLYVILLSDENTFKTQKLIVK